MADILQMHDLKPAPGANKDRIRVGRGEGSKGCLLYTSPSPRDRG